MNERNKKRNGFERMIKKISDKGRRKWMKKDVSKKEEKKGMTNEKNGKRNQFEKKRMKEGKATKKKQRWIAKRNV